MITIALLALVVMLVLGNSLFLHRSLVRAEVDKLYSICMHLQRVAMVTNQKQVLSFDVVRNTYIHNGHEERLCSHVIFGTIKDLKGPPSAPTANPRNAVTFNNNQITFTPRGILQAGTVYLTDKNKQYQYALTVPVSQISFLRKYRYNTQWHYLP